MSDYPINLKAENIKALVIGAGSVGLRKIDTLLKCNITTITVLDKNIQHADFAYNHSPSVHFLLKEFCEEDLENHNLVFVATDNKEVNSNIATICNNKNILCNVITNPHEGTFSLPALIQKEDILLTVSTKGLSPALSRALKEDIEIFIDSGYSALCAFLGKLRPRIIEYELTSDINKEIFTFFVNSPQKDLLLKFFQKNDEKIVLEIMQIFDKTFEQENFEKEKIKNTIQSLLAE